VNKVILIFLMVAVLATGGCSTLKSIPDTTSPPEDVTLAAQLGRARNLIREGHPLAARELLQKIVAGKHVSGVTDEALFHLGLLSLKDETEVSGYPQTRQVLDRLIRDYPKSIWAIQATSLNDLLVSRWLSEVSLEKVRRQVRTLKDSNLSLTRENKELRLNIEKLKNLEQELEQKSRR
jgi:hypothetical protein